MLALRSVRGVALSLTFFSCVVYGVPGDLNHQAQLQSSSQPWTEACLPFDQAAVAQANLTTKELAAVSELCYRPDLLPNLFLGTDSDRGIPPGVHCTPTKWYLPVHIHQIGY